MSINSAIALLHSYVTKDPILKDVCSVIKMI